MSSDFAPYPMETWQFFGLAGHFCCASECRFHMTTVIGPFMVSTVGKWDRSTTSDCSPDTFWEENPEGAEIGYDRCYETMVFRCREGLCECGCGAPNTDYGDIYMQGYKTAAEAQAGHMEVCHMVASQPEQDWSYDCD